jgi:uncharacterized membrane protein YbhN (UPF0104 family)
VKLAINLGLSLAMLALCLWLVWPDAATRDQLAEALRSLSLAELWPHLAAYLGLMLVIHACRCWRWNSLLAPLGVRIGYGRLWAVSSVGFMAILALPARLGEFVRPALIRKRGELSASAALGTVAVERVVDGLLVSLFVFGAFFALRGPGAPGWMMPTAYAALGVFAAAQIFLLFSLRWPERTVDFCLRLSLLPRLWPRGAAVIRTKLLEMIRGFSVLRDLRHMGVFMVWSITYWICNGLSVWVLARGMGLDLSVLGAFATMGLVAVGITLPNSPGLIGQFQWFTMLGLSLYLGRGVMQESPATPLHVQALAFAIVHHLLQVVWYVGMGALGLATRHVSFADLRGKAEPGS